MVDFGIARDALPINPHETYEEIRVRELLIKNGIFKDILYDEKGYPVAGVLDIGRVIASIDIVAPASVSEFFGVYQGNVLVKFYSSSGRRLPAGKYSLGTNETDGENSVSELNSTEGSTKLETRSVNVNDIPHEFYLQIRNQVASGNISISDVRKMVAEYVAGDVAPEISKAEFVDGTVTTESATFAVSAKNAGGGVAHMAIVRGKKLSPGDIKAIKLEAIKAGTIGEYLPVKLDANGAGAATITGDDGMDMTVVTFVENAKGKPSNEATGNSVTLLSLSKFDGTPSCMLNANSLSGTCTATITGPDATVYVAYFAQELSDLSNVSAIKNGTGAGASTHFSTNNKTGSGTISFTQAGTYYGYAITVGPNGTPKTATPMGSLTVAATTTAPTLSSITCDADAETCAIKTDTAQTKVHVAVE
ncbi:MAG TPA: hypothetical protein PK765_04085 [bacterium]|nr:hypothetical protein [bacterium]